MEGSGLLAVQRGRLLGGSRLMGPPCLSGRKGWLPLLLCRLVLLSEAPGCEAGGPRLVSPPFLSRGECWLPPPFRVCSFFSQQLLWVRGEGRWLLGRPEVGGGKAGVSPFFPEEEDGCLLPPLQAAPSSLSCSWGEGGCWPELGGLRVVSPPFLSRRGVPPPLPATPGGEG